MASVDSPPLILVTMLGNGDYKPAIYSLGALDFETELFPEAVVHWCRPAQVLVLTTQSVLQATDRPHLQNLSRRLQSQCIVTPVSIPDGRSETELWQIFAAMIDQLPHGCRVVLDVTHGFRSLPMVALLAALYLRQSDRVQVERIVYGAWEARDPLTNKAPVFDLTPFLDMANWMSAANVFLKTGHAGLIADILKQTQRSAWMNDGSASSAARPTQLVTLASNLQFLSEALLMTRADDISRTAGLVSSSLARAETELQHWAWPFAPMLERLQTLTSNLQQPGLQAQRELLHWYLEHGHIVQCVTLAREWMISLVQETLAVTGEIADARRTVEEVLGRSLATKRTEISNAEEPSAERTASAEITVLISAFRKLAQKNDIESAWSRLADLRNDVAHCGMRKQPRPTSAIRKLLDETIALLDQLKLPSSAAAPTTGDCE
jgi:CRISPR-associated DxTHG motif protein